MLLSYLASRTTEVLPDGRTLRIVPTPVKGVKEKLDQGRLRESRREFEVAFDRVLGESAKQEEVYDQIRACVRLPFSGETVLHSRTAFRGAHVFRYPLSYQFTAEEFYHKMFGVRRPPVFLTGIHLGARHQQKETRTFSHFSTFYVEVKIRPPESRLWMSGDPLR